MQASVLPEHEVRSHPVYGFNVLTLKIGSVATIMVAGAILLLIRTPGGPGLALAVLLLSLVFELTRRVILPRVRTYRQLDATVAFYQLIIFGTICLAAFIDTENKTAAGVCCFLIVFSFLFVSHTMFVGMTILGSTSWLATMHYVGGWPSNLDFINLFVTAPATASVARIAILGSTRDLLKSRAAERETVLTLQESIRQLNRETELRKESEKQLQMAQKNQSLGQLATGVAHDFNNLLLGISAFAENIHASSKDKTIQDNSSHIVNAVTQAADICRHMLTYAGKSGRQMQLLSPATLATETLPLLRVAVNSPIELQIQETAENLQVTANDTQLQQVMMNLITNAADASENSETITLSISDLEINARNIKNMPEIACGASLQPGLYKQLEIKDRGRGIPDHVKSQIFDPYFTTKKSGHGLGLSLVHGVVSSHNATLFMKSGTTTGTTATLLLPAVAAPMEIRDIPEPAEPRISPDGGRRILVVDDDAMVREPLVCMLQVIGWDAVPAESGQMALQIITNQPDFDVLLIDFRMPDMNGHETLLQARRLGCVAPAILCSGHVSAPELDRILADFATLLPKPFRRAELENVLQEVCREAPPESR